jgi:twitching motility protein PilT
VASTGSVHIDKLLHTVIGLKASDLHISVGQPPVIRHNGRLRRLDAKVLDNDDTTGLMNTPDRCQQELQEVGGADFAIEFVDGYRFRTAVFKQRGNIGIVMRASEPVPVLRTDRHAGRHQAAHHPPRLLLVTGPTGSGKTTSLASMINFINQNYDRHIITLEDPIEYYHKHGKCTVNQPRDRWTCPTRRASAGAHGPRRHPRRRNARPGDDPRRHRGCRNRPRRPATLHTSGASSTINRIIDVFPKEQQDQIRTQLDGDDRRAVANAAAAR